MCPQVYLADRVHSHSDDMNMSCHGMAWNLSKSGNAVNNHLNHVCRFKIERDRRERGISKHCEGSP